ncbi:MAG TPA: choline ABC transporter substrate-binding protein [Burkholderiaceae bacterium]|nr:choline ABC transporter substrate-binding protein [Burkholderiaceae bacterium]
MIVPRAAALALLGALALASSGAHATEPAECRPVRFADIGWTDITATTSLATVVLNGLGYKPVSTIASVPIAFTGLKKKSLDVFLGYWNPSMVPIIDPFLKDKSFEVLPAPNLSGAKYTLAVPTFVADAGLKSFADIARFRTELDGKIYGIEPGNDGNALIQKMIAANQFGLSGFRLVESSEAGMLIEVQRAIDRHKFIVFLGWEPHPMNERFKMSYLSGGDSAFGANYGGAAVYTVVANGYLQRCPNAGTLIRNLKFELSMESQVMSPILQKRDPVASAQEWLRANPAVLADWLKGVQTFDGKDGTSAVRAYLGLH